MKIKDLNLGLLLLTLLATLTYAPAAFANDWDAAPELESRQNVAIRTGYDGPRYNSLRTCLRRFSSQADVTYFGALVGVTDPEGNRSRDHDDATEYAEFLAQEWAELGRVDLDNDVVVALGFTNRSVGVYVGEKWRRLGLSEEDIADTIAASPFPGQMSRQGYNDAMCSVATAMDQRLATLEETTKRNIEKAQEIFGPALERYQQVHSRVEESLPEENEVRASLLEQLQPAESLRTADENLEDAPLETIAAAEELQKISDKVEDELDRYLADIEPLDGLEERINIVLASIPERDDKDWSGPTAARERLASCQQQVSSARLTADVDLLEIQKCLHDAERELARSDVRYFFLARSFPTTGFILFVIFLLTFVATRFLRRRRALTVLTHDLESWKRSLDGAQQKLQLLQTRFPWYFQDRQEFWEGESAAKDRQIADGINCAFLFHKRGTALLEEATSLHGRSKLLNVGKLEKALRVLRKTSVSCEAGTMENERPLALPITNRIESKGSHLLQDLDAAHFQAMDALYDVATVQQEIADLNAKAEAADEAAKTEIDKRRARRLPVDHLEVVLQEARQGWSRASLRAKTTPDEGARALEVAVEKLEDIHALARKGNRALEAVEGEIADLQRKVQALHESATRNGSTFEDGDFNPAEIHQRSEEICAQITDLVASGHEDQATAVLDPLINELEHTAIRLSVCLEAGDVVPEMVRDIKDLQPKMKEPLFHLRMQLQRLDGDEAAANEVEEQVEELSRLQKLVHRLERIIDGISNSHSEGKTLTAIADLSTLVNTLETGTKNLATIERYIDEASDDDMPPVPNDPIWQPPEIWKQNSASIWGASEDADEFRSITASGKKTSRRKRRSLPTIS